MAIYHLKSKEESFLAEEEKPEGMNFSESSSIQEDTVTIGCKQEVEWSIRKQGERPPPNSPTPKKNTNAPPPFPGTFSKTRRLNFSEDKNLHET